MSAATFIPGDRAGGQGPLRRGATATGFVHFFSHRLGAAPRAARTFTEAFFSVTVLGEYDEEAGVRRR